MQEIKVHMTEGSAKRIIPDAAFEAGWIENGEGWVIGLLQGGGVDDQPRVAINARHVVMLEKVSQP